MSASKFRTCRCLCLSALHSSSYRARSWSFLAIPGRDFDSLWRWWKAPCRRWCLSLLVFGALQTWEWALSIAGTAVSSFHHFSELCENQKNVNKRINCRFKANLREKWGKIVLPWPLKVRHCHSAGFLFRFDAWILLKTDLIKDDEFISMKDLQKKHSNVISPCVSYAENVEKRRILCFISKRECF